MPSLADQEKKASARLRLQAAGRVRGRVQIFLLPEISPPGASGNVASDHWPRQGKPLTRAPICTHSALSVSVPGPDNATLRVRRQPTRPSLIFIDCGGQSTVRRGFKGPFRERVRVWLTNSFREPRAGSSFLVPPPPFAPVPKFPINNRSTPGRAAKTPAPGGQALRAGLAHSAAHSAPACGRSQGRRSPSAPRPGPGCAEGVLACKPSRGSRLRRRLRDLALEFCRQPCAVEAK